MRVLIFHPALSPYRIDLFNALADEFELKVIFFHENLLSQKFDQSSLRTKLQAEHCYLTKGVDIASRSFRFGVRKEIISFVPDVVITQEFSSCSIWCSLLSKLPNNKFKHLIWTDDNPSSVERDNLLRKLLRTYFIRYADGMIFVSDEAIECYRRRFNFSGPAAVVPILQPEAKFRQRLFASVNQARQYINAYALQGKRVLLFVGRLVQEKRVDRLLNLYAKLADDIKDSQVVIVGDGSLRGKLEALTRELGIAEKVLFVGRQEGAELLAWYLTGNVFALLSECERFGAVVNEALLSGVPVVCSSKVGAKGLVIDGRNGSVVDLDDDTVLYSAIAHWMEHCVPVSSKGVEKLKPSLMTVRYVDAVANYVHLLRSFERERGVLKQ